MLRQQLVRRHMFLCGAPWLGTTLISAYNDYLSAKRSPIYCHKVLIHDLFGPFI